MRKNKESSSKNKTTVSKKWTVVVSCWLLAGSGNHCPRISLLNPDETGVHNGPFAILFLQNHLAALVHEPEQDDRSIHFWVKDNLFCFRHDYLPKKRPTIFCSFLSNRPLFSLQYAPAAGKRHPITPLYLGYALGPNRYNS